MQPGSSQLERTRGDPWAGLDPHRRSRGRRSGGPDCTVAIAEGQSIGQRVAALREIGLFADRPDVSNEDVSQRVEARLDELYGGDALADDPLLELVVASLDQSRVWWGDLEADVGDVNQVYAQTLEEWAAISKGSFEPEDVRETWASESGPVTVSFTLDGEEVELKPEYLEDWIDPRIITPINERIADSGRQFELFQAFDQSAFLMALTDGRAGRAGNARLVLRIAQNAGRGTRPRPASGWAGRRRRLSSAVPVWPLVGVAPIRLVDVVVLVDLDDDRDRFAAGPGVADISPIRRRGHRRQLPAVQPRAL